jgi:hypothetical protein
MFVGLGPTLMMRDDVDPTRLSQSSPQWQDAITEYETAFDEIVNIEAAIGSVRVADSEEHVMAVQILTEAWLRSFLQYWDRNALAFVAMMKGDDKRYRELRQKEAQADEAVKNFRGKLALSIRNLHDENPSQFASFAPSENDLIDLGLEDLVHD